MSTVAVIQHSEREELFMVLLRRPPPAAEDQVGLGAGPDREQERRTRTG